MAQSTTRLCYADDETEGWAFSRNFISTIRFTRDTVKLLAISPERWFQQIGKRSERR